MTPKKQLGWLGRISEGLTKTTDGVTTALPKPPAWLGDVAASLTSGVPLEDQLLASTPYFSKNEVAKVVRAAGDATYKQKGTQAHRMAVAGMHWIPAGGVFNFSDKSRFVDRRNAYTNPTDPRMAQEQADAMAQVLPAKVPDLRSAAAQDYTGPVVTPAGFRYGEYVQDANGQVRRLSEEDATRAAWQRASRVWNAMYRQLGEQYANVMRNGTHDERQ